MQPIDKPPVRLLFDRPVDLLGGGEIQPTVRLGAKWRDIVGANRLTGVPVLLSGEQDPIGTAEITGALFGTFKEYAPFAVNAADYDGDLDKAIEVLSSQMEDYYPDFDAETSQVTIVFFKFAPSESVVEKTAEEADASGAADPVEDQKPVTDVEEVPVVVVDPETDTVVEIDSTGEPDSGRVMASDNQVQTTGPSDTTTETANDGK